MRAELKALRAELNALKAQQTQAATAAAASADWNDRVDAVELKQKDAVGGWATFGGSFRLPGSETSIRVYGFAEANLIKDFKGTAPGDNFTNVMEQPVGNDAKRQDGADRPRPLALASRHRPPWPTAPSTTKVEADFYGYAALSATATACACAMPMASTRAG